MASPYPHLFDNIGSLHRQTQLYTQRRQNSELPENYKFTIEQMATFLVAEFQLVVNSDLWYFHTQSTPANIWVVNHQLGRSVQARCVDTDENNIVGEIFEDSQNQITISFTNAVSGHAVIT